MKVKELTNWLDGRYPADMAEHWDNVGLLVGDDEAEVHHVLLALDLTEKTLDEAISAGADMIITHHPMIFEGQKKINNHSFTGRRILKLIRNRIQYYAMHTNYDVLGMAELSADYLKLTDREVLSVTAHTEQGEEGFGRVGCLPYKMTLKECGEFVKEALALNDVRIYGDPDTQIEKAAICTGSGKSTLINLIPRFYDATKGCVKVDGVDVRNMTQHELRDRLGYVPQKGVLFSGTIDSNIRYGKPDMPEEDVKLAAQIAQSDDFIEAKPEGYKAPISQGGNNVSGGQKQRLSIARAIAKKPEILIFDDSFSALDFKTDSKLRKALKEKTKDITTIIVAQRISTILNADQIIVLDDGNMAGIGTHKELMEAGGLYRDSEQQSRIGKGNLTIGKLNAIEITGRRANGAHAARRLRDATTGGRRAAGCG